LATLQGHNAAIWRVVVDNDGRLLVSTGGYGTVRLWEARTGRPLATLQGHVGTVWGLALTPDGRLLASGGADGTVRLWEVGAGQPSVEGPGERQHPAEQSPVASSSGWRPQQILRIHSGGVWGVALTADGQLLASCGEDGTVRLWNVGTGKPVTTLLGHTGGVWGVALSADGTLVASAGEDGTVRLWEAAFAGRRQWPPAHPATEWLPLATLRGHIGAIRGVAVTADGRLVASAGGDGTVRLWETAARQLLATLPGHTGGAWGVAITLDGRVVASGGFDGTVTLWETSTGRQLANLQAHTGGVWGLALTLDGRLLATGSFDGTVRLWETSTGTCLRTLRAERRYERLDISGLTGVTTAQRAALLALGAIDHAEVVTPVSV
jgi:WD40 repeat protein